MKTGLITSDTYKNHDTGPGHPEQIARVSVIEDNFKKLNNKNLLWKKPSKVSDEILLTTHNTGSGHPESISRVTSIVEALKKNKKLIL